MTLTVSQALNKIISRQDLTHAEMLNIMRQMMSGQVSPVLMAALLAALRVKSESPVEISAAAQAMREFATQVQTHAPNLVDICGTGGDGASTFNISTTAMFVAAAAGANVAKHGGRSVSSQSGSADVLEHLGVNINLQPAQIAQCIEDCGIGFMFAPNHHSAMKHIAPVRKELGIRTMFNILGPLTNPAGAQRQLMGVFHPDLVPIQAEVLRTLGSVHVLIVNAESGLDELALTGATHVAELKAGAITQYTVTAQQFGFPQYTEAELSQGLRAVDLKSSAAKMHAALNNEPGPARDIVALNAAGALLAADVASDWQQAVDLAISVMASGAAKKKLDQFIAVTAGLSASAPAP
jgi:anthranilate phosphoribosyltransferase